MSIARARVAGRFDNAGSAQSATVGPYRRRRVYTLPLATVAEMVCHRILLAEAAEKRRAKRAKKAQR